VVILVVKESQEGMAAQERTVNPDAVVNQASVERKENAEDPAAPVLGDLRVLQDAKVLGDLRDHLAVLVVRENVVDQDAKDLEDALVQ